MNAAAQTLPACVLSMGCLCAAHARGLAASAKCNTSETPTIVRIIAVRDTRDMIEVGDRWVPVAGTGLARSCDRCGREHEVHVDVELDTGDTAVIGAGCARGESMEIVATIKSAVSAAKTRARLAGQLDAARTALATARADWATVQALPVPAIVVDSSIDRHGAVLWSMGDADVWVRSGSDLAERRQSLLNSWRSIQFTQRGHAQSVWQYVAQVEDLETRLARVVRKLAKLTGSKS